MLLGDEPRLPGKVPPALRYCGFTRAEVNDGHSDGFQRYEGAVGLRLCFCLTFLGGEEAAGYLPCGQACRDLPTITKTLVSLLPCYQLQQRNRDLFFIEHMEGNPVFSPPDVPQGPTSVSWED